MNPSKASHRGSRAAASFVAVLALTLVQQITALRQATAAVGPTSTLYITNYGELAGGTATGLDMIQGLTVNTVPTTYPLGINIAVYGDVRTMGYSNGDKGSKFDLLGNPVVGGPYTNNIANSQLHDGTSDGAYNYSIDYTTGDVLRFDRNWASPSTLFNVTNDIPGGGWITMDTANGSFWISQWGGSDLVAHYTSTGTLLGTFNSGVLGSAGLAFDPVDGTLWMGDSSFNLHQFNQTGVPLQTVGYSVQGSWYGMEFDTTLVPEPSTWVLLAIGVAGLWWRRRRAVN